MNAPVPSEHAQLTHAEAFKLEAHSLRATHLQLAMANIVAGNLAREADEEQP